MKVVRHEGFGPVISVQRFKNIEIVCDRKSASRLEPSVACSLSDLIWRFAPCAVCDTDGVIFMKTQTRPTDQLAEGVIKGSGVGREAPLYAIRSMTEDRLVVFNL